jgi:hypothetical protein
MLIRANNDHRFSGLHSVLRSPGSDKTWFSNLERPRHRNLSLIAQGKAGILQAIIFSCLKLFFSASKEATLTLVTLRDTQGTKKKHTQYPNTIQYLECGMRAESFYSVTTDSEGLAKQHFSCQKTPQHRNSRDCWAMFFHALYQRNQKVEITIECTLYFENRCWVQSDFVVPDRGLIQKTSEQMLSHTSVSSTCDHELDCELVYELAYEGEILTG